MKIIVEGYPYPKDKVEHIMEGLDSLTNTDGLVRPSFVGYFYNNRIGDCVFFLPKVVLNEQGLMLNKYTPEEVIDLDHCKAVIANEGDFAFIHEFSVWIYRAIKEFMRLNEGTNIVFKNTYSRIDGTNRKVDSTLVDIILSLLKYNRDNRNFLMFIARNMHSGYNKINWGRTISRSEALLQDNGPIYMDVVNKRRQVNFDEELIIIFYSILNYIRKYGFKPEIDVNYELITGSKFQNYLNGYGLRRLRQIKYKYFSDKALALWHLCYDFFDLATIINSSDQQEDYLLVKDFNIVFEDMIDELLSDKELKRGDLAEQEDGKRVDHIYAYDGLTNNKEKIYYIGDSKYYKIGSDPGTNSVYKQYTYARNVIQYNLDFFLKNPEGAGSDYLIYRDEETEGYNITPNFFISAMLNQDYDYTEDNLEFKKDAPPQRQFRDRLFDRDTLLLQHYNINFLFVLALYAGANEFAKEEFKKLARSKFRDQVINYLSSKYQFFSLQKKEGSNMPMKNLVDKYFRRIIGKTFKPYGENDLLYFACEINGGQADMNLDLLAALSNDFDIREYQLGTDPRDEINHYITSIKEQTGLQKGKTSGILFSFDTFPDEIFLFGGYRTKDKDQLSWILNNRKYNVRYSATRDGNVNKIRSKAIAARFLVLYDVDSPEHEVYGIYLLGNQQKMTESTMRASGYPEPDGNYLVYNITSELSFINFDINKIVALGRIAKLEELRKSHHITEDWEKSWQGSPIYFYGREL